jgi:malate permease and related proteins
MLTIFVNVVLPVFIVAGLGYLLKRRLDLQVGPLNQTVLYVLMPAFIFTSLLPVNFRSEEPLRITAFAFLLAIVMLLIGFAVARAMRLDRPAANALALTAALPNLGNYGLSVVLLAFGQPGLAAGSLLLAVQMLYGLALAVFIASSGSAPLGRAVAAVLRQPVIYAVAAALALNLANVTPPEFVMSALTLPSQAAIPVMLIVLGMNVAGTSGVEQPALVSIAVFVRLVVGTLVGWLLAVVLGIEGVARDVMIVGAAMPTAVFTILTATQFDARPKFVSDVVVASTLVSIVTVTVVLAVLSGTLSLL